MRKRRMHYEVTTFDHVMWCHKNKRWVSMEDQNYAEPGHKGYSSHKKCMTLQSALRSCRSLDQLTQKGKEITILRFSWPKGKRKIDEFIFTRQA